MVQAGNLAVFCSMAALGIEGDPHRWERDGERWRRMEAVRGAAAVLPGSVVAALREGEGPDVTIGHPSGQIALTAELVQEKGVWRSKKIVLNRTAREIMKGYVVVDAAEANT